MTSTISASSMISFSACATTRTRTRVEETRMDYGAVTGLFEDAGYLVVRMKHHTPLVVLKADVPGGQADALRDMLCRKTGQTVRRMRP